MAWDMSYPECMSVSLQQLHADFCLTAPDEWQRALPSSLSTLNTLFYHRVQQKAHRNSYAEMLMNNHPRRSHKVSTCDITTMGIEQALKTDRWWWCQQACAHSWVLNLESESLPLLWSGVLIRQPESDRRAGWVVCVSEDRALAGLDNSCFSWRLPQIKKGVYTVHLLSCIKRAQEEKKNTCCTIVQATAPLKREECILLILLWANGTVEESLPPTGCS